MNLSLLSITLGIIRAAMGLRRCHPAESVCTRSSWHYERILRPPALGFFPHLGSSTIDLFRWKMSTFQPFIPLLIATIRLWKSRVHIRQAVVLLPRLNSHRTHNTYRPLKEQILSKCPDEILRTFERNQNVGLYARRAQVPRC